VTLVAEELASQTVPGPIVTTVATTHMLQDIARKYGRRVITTAVGDLVVAKALQEEGGIFGCEENGGMIFPDFVWGRDGAMAAAYILHILARHQKPLSEVLQSLPLRYQVKTKITVDPAKKERILRHIDTLTAQEKNRITIDGYKVVFDDDSWVLIRPSGTEPLLRLFAESRDREQAENLVAKFRRHIEEV
jgi:phosphomannomutase/phosphoglucomutase